MTSPPPVQLHISDWGRQAAALASGQPQSTTHKKEESTTTEEWSPSSWQSKPVTQSVLYEDRDEVEKALKKLESLPPLVTPTEIARLRESLKEVALGNAFLLQGGDCAELFDYCSENPLDAKLKLLLQMSLVLIWGGNTKVVRIARIAGQFAKPRSSPTEVIDGVTVPSFRGDNINGFDPSERKPDPSRLVTSYFHSAATLNYIRAQLSSGFADLHHPIEWTLAHVQDSAQKAEYQAVVDRITDSIRFLQTINADASPSLNTIDLYTSHEGLLLEYEQSLTRLLRDPASSPSKPVKKWYNTSGHFLWIGDRTRQLDGAHVEYFRGIQNPIGIKVGPSMQPDELVRLLDIVDADKEPGRVTLITRYGAGKVKDLLPGHIQAVQKSGHIVVWQSDPMHGNTFTAPSSKVKTRSFTSIMSEIQQCLQIHKENNSRLGGVHLELTGDPVTECIGGSEGLEDEDLNLNYATYCDPRLNNNQALDVAFLISSWFREDLEAKKKAGSL
ncbi:DAHP synthetase [Ascobolus immersus RN42]|uniref:Phospho-2-dehydro-3-deoxyheptonate aldolase n=1 Tax=Ascobolus immersus RN42 TaxID=1160509 RepID=A0A3N4IK27_ASCIM|nr:DAHP synthetase [Ascobolus immersus RN42]